MTDLTALPNGYGLNVLRQTGGYVVHNPGDAPDGVTNAFVTVCAGNINGIKKVTQCLNDADTGTEYFRALASGGWTDWAERGAGGGGGGGAVLGLTGGAPDDGEGEDDDVRIDPETGDVYIKVSGSWGASGNMFSAQDDAFWTTTVKGITTTRQSVDVVAADPELKFHMEADRGYLFRFYVWYESAGTPDFKFALSGPASPDKVTLKRAYITPNTAAWNGVGEYGAYASIGTTINQTGGTRGFIELDGIIENGPNAGDVEFQWSQGTSTASDTSVLRGSYVEFKDHFDC